MDTDQYPTEEAGRKALPKFRPKIFDKSVAFTDDSMNRGSCEEWWPVGLLARWPESRTNLGACGGHSPNDWGWEKTEPPCVGTCSRKSSKSSSIAAEDHVLVDRNNSLGRENRLVVLYINVHNDRNKWPGIIAAASGHKISIFANAER